MTIDEIAAEVGYTNAKHLPDVKKTDGYYAGTISRYSAVVGALF